jgi:hypothetical protein
MEVSPETRGPEPTSRLHLPAGEYLSDSGNVENCRVIESASSQEMKQAANDEQNERGG